MKKAPLSPTAPRSSPRPWLVIAVASLLPLWTCVAAPAVAGLRGLAQFSRDGGAFRPLKPGTVLQNGDTLQTATDSALDLNLGPKAGTLRLLQSTTLQISSIDLNQVLLNLKGGEVVGNPGKQPASGKYRIEVPGGIAGIVAGDFRLNAKGYLVVIDGKALFAEATSGEPRVHSLDGTVYFSPQDNAVHPAPKELQKDVRTQLKARLPR